MLFVHTPFFSMVRFLSLAQFPVDQLSYPVMPSLFCQFVAFAFYVISSFLTPHNYHFLCFCIPSTFAVT